MTKQIEMLRRIAAASVPILELALVASGGRSALTLNRLRRAGFVAPVDHPSVKDAFGYPARAFEATEAGRAELERKA